MNRPFQKLVKKVSNFFTGTKGVHTPNEQKDRAITAIKYHPDPNTGKYRKRKPDREPGITKKQRKAKRREQGNSRNINHIKAKY
jgi:hypothetical protein